MDTGTEINDLHTWPPQGVPNPLDGPIIIGDETDESGRGQDAGPRYDVDNFGPIENIGCEDAGSGNLDGGLEPGTSREPERDLTDLGAGIVSRVVEAPVSAHDGGRADDHADEPVNGTLSEAVPEAPGTPAGAHDGGDVPPDVPPLVTIGEGEPDRGAALKTLVDLVQDINPTAEQRAHAEVLNRYGDDEIQQLMTDQDLTREQAINRLADRLIPAGTPDGVTSIRMDVIADEIERAEHTYGPEMEAAGVRVTSPFFDDIRLRLTDAGHYTEAVGQMPTPESAEEQAKFNAGTELLIREAVDTAAKSIIADDPRAAHAATSWHESLSGISQPASAEEHGLAVGLAENAEALAVNLAAKGVPPSVSDPIRQLGVAHTERLTTEWAVGVTLGIIGGGDTLIGIERVSAAGEWQPIYGYVRRLVSRAPNAALTREVRDTLLADVQTALHAPAVEYPEDYTQTVSTLFNVYDMLLHYFNA